MSNAYRLDPYQPDNSPIHKLDARVKFIITMGFILICAMLPVGSWVVYPLLFSVTLSLASLSWLGILYVLKRSLWALPFILAALPLVFTNHVDSLFQVNLHVFVLQISKLGLERFVNIALKTFLSVQAATILVSTTSFSELMQAMRWLRIPGLLVAVIGLMWRYLFLLVAEAERLLRARSSRSSTLSKSPAGGGRLLWRAQVTGKMAGNLFLRSIERSERVYAAMLSRGYNGEVLTARQVPLSINQWILMIIFLLFEVLILLFSLVGTRP